MRALLVLTLLAGTAAADPRLTLRVNGNRVEARVVGATGTGSIQLRDPLGEHPPVAPLTVTGFMDGPPAALAIVHNANDLWVDGGWEYEHGDAQVPLFEPLVAAFSRARIVERLPRDSSVLLVNYVTGAEIVQHWQPAGALVDAQWGTEKDYSGRVGTDLVEGVTLAYTELAKRPEARKIVLLVGDGNDTNNELAVGKLEALHTLYPDVVVVALIIRTAVSPEGRVIDGLTDERVRLQPSAFDTGIAGGFAFVAERFEATFDVAALPRDGARHTLVLDQNGTPLASATYDAPSAPVSPPMSRLVRGLLAAAIGAVVTLVAALALRKPAR